MNPEDFATAFDERIDATLEWLADNGANVFDLINDALKGLYQAVFSVLNLAPFYIVAVLIGLLAWRMTGLLRFAVGAALALCLCALMGLWPETMSTLALVLTATCTHKEAQVLSPFYLDVDKAIRVWNQLFPGAKDKIRMDETTLRQIAETEGSTTEKSFNIISGASLGSSFVGMVHVLNTEDTTTSQDDESRAKDMKATLSLGSAIASLKGGFGVDKNFAEDVKRLLSTQNITSHVTLITAGYIPTIKANQVALGVKQFANFDPSDMMTSLAKLSDFTSADRASLQQAATAARTKGEFVALKTANIESVMQSLAKLDDGQNSMLDISSMVVAFEDYVNTAAAATPEAAIGVPINYYLKPITRTQLAQMWVSKYYPNKYLDIQGDDTPRPKQDAAATT